MSVTLNRRRFIGISAAAAGLTLLPFGNVAQTQAQAFTWRGRALGAQAEVILHHHHRAQAEQLVLQVAAEIARLERIFSLYDRNSALSELNRLGVLAAPPAELVLVLEKSRTIWELSGGLFDPTVQPLWQVYAQHYSVPTADSSGPSLRQIEAALRLIGFDRVAFSRNRIALAQSGMALTLNGIAQGYITDRIVDLLRAGGIGNTLVDVGEIRASGARDDGTPWRVGIAGAGAGAPPLDLVDRAIATSSSNGFRFAGPGSPGHLLHPRNGASANLYESVSVLAPEAATADALSTAIGFMNTERIAELLAPLPGIEAHLVQRDGTRLHFG